MSSLVTAVPISPVPPVMKTYVMCSSMSDGTEPYQSTIVMGLSPITCSGNVSRCYDGQMPRWNPDARARLVVAALELFAERGFDGATVAEISTRAGLTKSTFFRHFPDKREVLAAGQGDMLRQLVEGISSASPEASPLQAISSGLDRVSGAMTSFQRELGPSIRKVIAENVELQERDAAKHAALTAGMIRALGDRGVPERTATVAAHLGTLAFSEAYAAWIDSESSQDLGSLARTALAEFSRAAGDLDGSPASPASRC